MTQMGILLKFTKKSKIDKFLMEGNFYGRSKLINYSTADYGSKADMELALYRWKEKRDTLMPMLKAKGLV